MDPDCELLNSTFTDDVVKDLKDDNSKLAELTQLLCNVSLNYCQNSCSLPLICMCTAASLSVVSK